MPLAASNWARHNYFAADTHDAQINQEVEAFFLEMRNKRHLNQLSTDPQLQRILTKEECLTLFRATGVPPPGALWGVFC